MNPRVVKNRSTVEVKEKDVFIACLHRIAEEIFTPSDVKDDKLAVLTVVAYMLDNKKDLLFLYQCIDNNHSGTN